MGEQGCGFTLHGYLKIANNIQCNPQKFLCEAVALIMILFDSVLFPFTRLVAKLHRRMQVLSGRSKAAVNADIRYESKKATNQNGARPFNDVIPHANRYIHGANWLLMG